MARVVVLGGSGFVGSNVIDGLIGIDGAQVWSVDRSPERFRRPLHETEFFRCDFGNRGAIEEILSQGVDVVIHLISSTIPSSSNKDPIFDIQSNLVETVAFLDLAVKYKVKKIIFASSGGTVYGDQKVLPIPESATLWPKCSYGIVKATIEKYLNMYQQLHGIETVSLRLSNPYGPRQDPTRPLGAIGVFLYRCLKGEPIEIWGDGEIVRDYIYIDDFRDAVVAAVKNNMISGCYNIGSGVAISLNDVVCSMQNIGLQPVVKYLPPRGCDAKAVVLDCQRAKKDFEWAPVVSLEVGMKRTMEWMDRMLREGVIE